MSAVKQVIDTIGRQAVIDLPDFGIHDVPAKVDTGADSSSIWAGSVSENDSGISFVLFDRESPYYNGKEITTRDFKVVSVKNSFGKTEYRYKVKLPTIVEGRKIKVQYTLSDRAHSKYPVLIGRNTLKGRFVVDVAKRPVAKKKEKMLLLSLQHTENVGNMIKNIENYSEGKVDIDYVTYSELTIRFKDNAMSISIDRLGTDVADYSIVHFKTSLERDLSASIARYVLANGGRIVDDAVQHFPGMSKLYQYSILSAAGIQVPDSVFVIPEKLHETYQTFASELGLPFVLKGLHSSRGEINVVINSEQEFTRAAKGAVADRVYVVGQKFIPNDGDYRVLVFGKEIALVIHRIRKDDTTHLNNTSAGGTATLVPVSEIPARIQTDCIHAAAVMGRSIAGVDYIQDARSGDWLCLEVNDGPQLATGAFIEEKHRALAKYFVKELEK